MKSWRVFCLDRHGQRQPSHIYDEVVQLQEPPEVEFTSSYFPREVIFKNDRVTMLWDEGQWFFILCILEPNQ